VRDLLRAEGLEERVGAITRYQTLAEVLLASVDRGPNGVTGEDPSRSPNLEGKEYER
jgi:hypothetical protein